jgi:hypothetical protein
MMPLEGVGEVVVGVVGEVAFEVAAEAAGSALDPRPLPSRRRTIARMLVLAALALPTAFGLAAIVAASWSSAAFVGGSLVGLFLLFILYGLYRDVRRLAG